MKIKNTILTLACINSMVYAQDLEHINLDKIQVSTTSLGAQEEIADVDATVQVIDNKQIEKSNARSLPQLLNQATSLIVNDAGSTSSVSIRGFESSHSLVLIDGLRRTGKYGSFDLTSVQLEDIERVEIVRGPMSTIYGADAIAGVINIITKKGFKENFNKVSVTYGQAQNGQRETVITKLSGSQTVENIAHNYAIEIRDKEDYRLDKSATATDLKNESRVFLNYGHVIKIDDDNRITNKFEYANQDDDGKNSSDYDTYEKEDRYQFTSNYNHINDKFIFDTSLAYGVSDTNVDRGTGEETTDYKQLEFNNYLRDIRSDVMTNILGVGYKNDDIDVSIYDDKASRDNYFVLFQNEYDFTENFSSNIGVRYDYFDDFGSTTNPKFSLMYKYEEFSFRTSYGTAFKAPSFTNMYSQFTRSGGGVTYNISGNPDLEPEESETQEYAISYTKGNLFLELVHHRTNLDNLIDSYTTGGSYPTFNNSYRNIDESSINGTEVSISYKLNSHLTLKSSLEFLDTEDKSTGDRLTGSARDTYKASVMYQKNKFGAFFDLKSYRSYYGNSTVRNVNETQNYTVADVKFDYQLTKNSLFFIGVDNIQDKIMPYNMTSRGTPNDPGERYYYAGMTYKF